MTTADDDPLITEHFGSMADQEDCAEIRKSPMCFVERWGIVRIYSFKMGVMAFHVNIHIYVKTSSLERHHV